MSENLPRYRVEVYTERHDGMIVWCVCDYISEAETGASPILDEPDLARHYLTTDRAEAQHFADELNAPVRTHSGAGRGER